MEHAGEIELIELAARRLAAEREKAVQAHLEGCPACRAKLQDIQRTWDLLGAWQVHPAGHKYVAGRGASSEAQEKRRAPILLRFPGLRTAVRIAAAIAVSVLIGYAGGRWSVSPIPMETELKPPPYFSALAFEVGDSFASLVLQDEPSSSRGG